LEAKVNLNVVFKNSGPIPQIIDCIYATILVRELIGVYFQNCMKQKYCLRVKMHTFGLKPGGMHSKHGF
jgi:hypothetical protein